jgi:hypothetical protein
VEFITTLDLAKDFLPLLCKANNKKSLDREQKITISLIERREKRNQVGIEKLLVNYYLLLLKPFFGGRKKKLLHSISQSRSNFRKIPFQTQHIKANASGMNISFLRRKKSY